MRVLQPYVVVRITSRSAQGGAKGDIVAYRATEAEGLAVAQDRHDATGAYYEVWSARPPGDIYRLRPPATLEA